MKREFYPSPLKEVSSQLKWLIVLMLIGGLGRWWLLLGISAVIFLFHLLFYRNPQRESNEDGSVLVAPADGRITDIIHIDEPSFIKGKACRIGIFLSIFNVHTQPAPCDGTLRFIEYQPGRFLDARNPEASPQNESQTLGLETSQGYPVVVKQIAGWIARRIVLWRFLDEEVKRGELLGMIRYGSRVELFLPAGLVEVTVKVGDRVQGGRTPIVRWLVQSGRY